MNRNLSVELRPSKLSEVIGHRQTVAAITKQLATRVPVAFLFSGQPGVGKTTLARIIANELGASEVTEINASDTNGVGDARELVKSTDYMPLSGKYRVIILDEAQKLTEAAQNVLLKSFETPGSTVYVIATTEPAKLLPALRDRCVSYHLSPMEESDVNALIARAAKHADVTKEITDLMRAVHKAEISSPRSVLMAAERYFAGIAPEDAVHKTDEPVEYFETIREIARGDWKRARLKLATLKFTDAKGFRSSLAGYLRALLLKEENEDRATAISDCIFGLVQTASFEDGLSWSGTIASCYRVCKKLSKR